MKLTKFHIKLGKYALAVLALLLIGGQAWGADTVAAVETAGTSVKYKSGNLSNCTDASGWTGSSNLRAAAQAALNDYSLYICDGTYSGNMINGGTGFVTVRTNQIISGQSKAGTILDGTGIADYFMWIQTNPYKVQNLTIKNVPLDRYSIRVSVPGVTISDVNILDVGKHLFLSAVNSDTIFNRVTFGRTYATDYAVAASNTSEAVFNYCNFENLAGSIIPSVNLNLLSFNNCVFTGCKKEVFSSNSTGTWNFINCGFAGNNLDAANTVLFYTNSKGTYNFTNNMLALPVRNSGAAIYQGTPTWNETGTSAYYYPLFKTPSRAGAVFVYMSDTENLANWKTMSTAANALGIKTSFNMFQANSGAVDWESLAAYVTAGNEIISHGWSGTRTNTMNAFTATKAGSSIVIAATRTDANDSSTWSGTLTLDAEAPIDLMNASYDSLNEVIAYLAGKGVTIGSATGQLLYNDTTFKPKSISLAAGTYNIDTTQTLLFHENSLLTTEMKDSKAYLESKITPYLPAWTCKSFAYSGGYNTANSQSYALGTAGYSQALGLSTDVAGVASARLESINMAIVRSIDMDLAFGDTDADIKNNLYNLLTGLEQIGAVSGIGSHGFSGFTEAQWGYLLTHLAAWSGTITKGTFAEVMDWVRANDDHVTGTVSYKCSTGTDSCWPLNGDYGLQPDSPAIGAGVLITGLHDQATPAKDYPGVDVTWGPSIGAYQPTGAAPTWANLNGVKLLRAAQAVTISGDHSAETLDLSNAINTGQLTVSGTFELGKIIGNAAVPIVGSNARITGPLELGNNAKLHGFSFVHE